MSYQLLQCRGKLREGVCKRRHGHRSNVDRSALTPECADDKGGIVCPRWSTLIGGVLADNKARKNSAADVRRESSRRRSKKSEQMHGAQHRKRFASERAQLLANWSSPELKAGQLAAVHGGSGASAPRFEPSLFGIFGVDDKR